MNDSHIPPIPDFEMHAEDHLGAIARAAAEAGLPEFAERIVKFRAAAYNEDKPEYLRLRMLGMAREATEQLARETLAESIGQVKQEIAASETAPMEQIASEIQRLSAQIAGMSTQLASPADAERRPESQLNPVDWVMGFAALYPLVAQIISEELPQLGRNTAISIAILVTLRLTLKLLERR